MSPRIVSSTYPGADDDRSGTIGHRDRGLSKRIGAFFEKNVFVERAIDPALIGGFVLEGDGRRIDMSVKGQIERALLGNDVDNRAGCNLERSALNEYSS